MKLRLLFTFLITVSVSQFVLSQSFDSPTAYNDYIILEEQKIADKVFEFTSAELTLDNPKKLESKRQEVLKQIEKSEEKISEIKPYKKDTKLKEDALLIFKIYYQAFSADYQEASSHFVSKKNSWQALEKYYKAQEKAEEKIKSANIKFEEAQREFLKKYSLEFDSKKDSSDVTFEKIQHYNQYTRKLYLTYFKVFSINAELIDNMEKNNPKGVGTGIEQLNSIIDNSIQIIVTETSYEGYDEYRKAILDLVKFYQHQLKYNYPKLLETLNAGGDRTLEQVNFYNKTLQEYGVKEADLVNKFNTNSTKILQLALGQ